LIPTTLLAEIRVNDKIHGFGRLMFMFLTSELKCTFMENRLLPFCSEFPIGNIREFPIGNTAITVGLMVRLKPGTMLLFRFEVPRDQKQ
jgi:hypothetical protein